MKTPLTTANARTIIFRAFREHELIVQYGTEEEDASNKLHQATVAQFHTLFDLLQPLSFLFVGLGAYGAVDCRNWNDVITVPLDPVSK